MCTQEIAVKPFGPALPPGWTVGPDGISRHVDPDFSMMVTLSKAQEEAMVSEARALKAHDSRVTCSWATIPKVHLDDKNEMVKVTAEAITTGHVEGTKLFLSVIISRIEACHRLHREKDSPSTIIQDLHHNLSYERMAATLTTREGLAEVVGLVATHLRAVCLPSSRQLEELQSSVVPLQHVIRTEYSLDNATMRAILFVLNSIADVEQDLDSALTILASKKLQAEAVSVNRAYYAMLLRHPTQSVRQWLDRISFRGVTDPFKVKTLCSWAYVGLLKRMTTVPFNVEESFLRFDAENLKAWARQVHLLTLRLVVNGMTTAMLAKYKVFPQRDALVAFDSDVIESLQTTASTTLLPIRSCVVGFLNSKIRDRYTPESILSTDDDTLVHNVVERLEANPASPEYTLCHDRVMSVLQSTDLTTIENRRCGIVSADLTKVCKEVWRAFEFHWEVFCDFYTAQSLIKTN
jgi:hypothetical protein